MREEGSNTGGAGKHDSRVGGSLAGCVGESGNEPVEGGLRVRLTVVEVVKGGRAPAVVVGPCGSVSAVVVPPAYLSPSPPLLLPLYSSQNPPKQNKNKKNIPDP